MSKNEVELSNKLYEIQSVINDIVSDLNRGKIEVYDAVAQVASELDNLNNTSCQCGSCEG